MENQSDITQGGHNVVQNVTTNRVTSSNEERISLTMLLVFLLIISFTLNFFITYVFLRNQLLHTANNAFVCSLAVSDLLYGAISTAIPCVSLVNSDWLFGKHGCQAVGVLTLLLQSYSANNCALISFQRFVHIVYPQKKILIDIREAQLSLGLLWIYCIAVCMPAILKWSMVGFNQVVATCTVFMGHSVGPAFYLATVNFFLPAFLMIVFYCKICRAVLRHKNSVAGTNEVLRSNRIQRKTKQLALAVLIIFVLSWFPYHMLLLIGNTLYGQNGTLPTFAWILSIGSTILNPIIYAACNRLYCRCMIRIIQCKGPLDYTKQAGVAKINHFENGSLSDIKEQEDDEAPQSEVDKQVMGEANCTMSPKRNSGGSNSTRVSTISMPDNVLDVAQLQRHISAWSCVTDASDRSSIPTVMKWPIRQKGYSSASRASLIPFPPTPQAVSQRPSVVSNYAYYLSSRSVTPVTPDIPIETPYGLKRNSYYGLPGMRQSISSQLPSVRSSFASQLPSMRSSLASQFSQFSFWSANNSPNNTRPNSRQVSPEAMDIEYVYLSPSSLYSYSHDGHGGSDSKRSSSSTSFSTNSSKDSLGTKPPTRMSRLSRMSSFGRGYLRTRDSEIRLVNSAPSSPTSRKVSDYKVYSTSDTEDDEVSRQRVSSVMFGEMDLDEEKDMDRDSFAHTTRGRQHWDKTANVRRAASYLSQIKRRKKRAVQRAFRRQLSNISILSSSNSDRRTPSPKLKRDSQPRRLTPVDPKYPCPSEESSSASRMKLEDAAWVVLKARNLRSKIRAYVIPLGTDRHGEALKVALAGDKSFAALSPKLMSHLRVPGRPPPILLPQTIIEEDAISADIMDSNTHSPSCATPKRKNASVWIAPPVIDVDRNQKGGHGSTDMRVECPGVLVEHHN